MEESDFECLISRATDGKTWVRGCFLGGYSLQSVFGNVSFEIEARGKIGGGWYCHVSLDPDQDFRVYQVYLEEIFNLANDLFASFLEDEQREREQHPENHRTPDPPPTPSYVYVMRDHEFYKIGVSKDPERRRAELSRNSATDFEIILISFQEHASAVERALHYHFADKNIRSEWFRLDDDDLEHIRGFLDGNARRV